MKILIAGGPKTGKTTLSEQLAKRMGLEVKHTDSLIGEMDWSEQSEAVSFWMDEPGDWIIEGVSVGRAIRKWLKRCEGKPADRIFYLAEPFVELIEGQERMAKGCETVWSEIESQLVDRGCVIEEKIDEQA